MLSAHGDPGFEPSAARKRNKNAVDLQREGLAAQGRAEHSPGTHRVPSPVPNTVLIRFLTVDL